MVASIICGAKSARDLRRFRTCELATRSLDTRTNLIISRPIIAAMLALTSFAVVPAWYSTPVRSPVGRTGQLSMEIAGMTDASMVEKMEANRAAAAKIKASYKSMQLADMIGAGPETGGSQPWDPLNLASIPDGEIDKLAWWRAAEIKHGRVCRRV